MYRQIESRIWTDPKFRQLPSDGKLLFLYLLTNPAAHLSGIYYLPTAMISHETGLPNTLLDTLLDTLCDRGSGLGLASFDPQNEVVFIHNLMRYQARGEKAQRSAAKQLENLHDSFLIPCFLERYPGIKKYCTEEVLAVNKDQPDRVSDRVSHTGHRIQDTGNRTQEAEEEVSSGVPPDSCQVSENRKLDLRSEKNPDDDQESESDVRAVFEHWREVMEHPGAKLTAGRREVIRRALGLPTRQYQSPSGIWQGKRAGLGYSVESLCDAISGYIASAHHMGDNETGTRYDSLELLLRSAKQIDRGMDLHERGLTRPKTKQEQLEARNAAVMAEWEQNEDENDDED